MMVQITGDEYLDLLINRLTVWCNDPVIIALYEEMYQRYIYEGVFENNTETVMSIVDNDWINWCDVISDKEDEWNEIKKAYDNGERYLDNYIIEVFDNENKVALIRWY